MRSEIVLVVRYLLSPFTGVGAAFCVWLFLEETVGGGMSATGLLPVLAAGVFGGLVAAMVAPRHKILLPAMVGLLVGGSLVVSLMMSRMYPLGAHNPLFWYWPAWLIIAFPVGGALGRLASK